MKLDAPTFRQLRRLAPVLDDVLNAREVEYPHQAVNLAALAALCSQLFLTYEHRKPVGIEQARVDVKNRLPVECSPLSVEKHRLQCKRR